MTVESTISRAQYGTNGTTGPFTVPFRFLQNSDLQVIHTDADGNETTLTLDADYTVTGAGGSTGALTCATAYPSGGYLTILRAVEPLQEVDYVETDSFPAETHEMALDKLTMLMQQALEVVGRALVFAPSDVSGTSLPAAPVRAGKLLGFAPGTGALNVSAPADGSASALALALANAASASEGAGMSGFAGELNYAVRTIGWALKQARWSLTWFANVAGDGVTDDTVAIQAVIALAQATVQASAFNPAINDVGGVILDGGGKRYVISQALTENVGCIDFENLVLKTMFPSGGPYASRHAAMVIGSGAGWAGGLGTVTWRSGIRRLKIEAGNANLGWGVIVSGVRHGTFEDIKHEGGFCGMFVENCSESTFNKIFSVGQYYGFILDNRQTAASPLGFTRTNNDVSNNNFTQCSAQFSQHSAWVMLALRQNRFVGNYAGFWGPSPLGTPPLNLPTAAAGVHIVNNSAGTINSDCYYGMVSGFLFEADPSFSSDCFRITLPTTTGSGEGFWPILGWRFEGCYAQTYANDYAGGKVTTLFAIESSSDAQMEGMVIDGCGFMYLTAQGYYPQFMRMAGPNKKQGGMVIRNCPGASCLNGDGLGRAHLADVVLLEEVNLEAAGMPNANGWSGNGTYIGLVPGTGSAGVQGALRFSGQEPEIVMSKAFSLRRLKHKLGYIVVDFEYTGSVGSFAYVIVNNDATASSKINNADTRRVFLNAVLQPTSGSGRRVLVFRPFDPLSPFGSNSIFDSVTVYVGRNSVGAGQGASNVDITALAVGYIPQTSMKQFPAGTA